MPLVANWPSVIRPGQTTSQLVDASDFLPTFADLEGLQLPKNEPMDGISFAPSLLEKTGREREWCFFWYAPRPGKDKNRFSGNIFGLDHQYKLFSDGRFFEIDNLRPIEKELNLRTLTPVATAARTKLQAVIKNTMKPPLSPNSKKVVNAFGDPTDE